MTGERDEPGRSDLAQTLRLRPDPPKVTRLSRKVLVGLGALAALALAVALGYGLQPRGPSEKPDELYETGNRPAADGLASLPKDYAGLPRPVPQLGPPLPGDLGRPILNAGAAPNTIVPGATTSDPEARHLAQESESARVSRLFTQTSTRPQALVPAPEHASATETGLDLTIRGDGIASSTPQDRKVGFLNAPVDRRTVSPDRLAKPLSPYVVQAGTVIPAALVTGIRSDLPGQIVGQVTEAVYDTPTGRHLLIPQGARLIGQYDSSVGFGQNRVLLVWTRLILPDGTSIVLERQPGADTKGYAGLEDEVDQHWDKLFQAAVLSTLLGVGAEAGTSSEENDLIRAIRSGASDSISQTGRQIVQRQLDVQPTLTVRPGYPVRVIVTRDLVLMPYLQEAKP